MGHQQGGSLPTVSGQRWNLECWFLWREGKRRTRKKTLGARRRTNNKLNPTCDGTSAYRTRERYHHCVISSPLHIHSKTTPVSPPPPPPSPWRSTQKKIRHGNRSNLMRGPTLVRSVTVIMDPLLCDKLKENVGRVRLL